jgi:hypothetical protein
MAQEHADSVRLPNALLVSLGRHRGRNCARGDHWFGENVDRSDLPAIAAAEAAFLDLLENLFLDGAE